MLVRMNHLEFTTESKSTKLSCMRFYLGVSDGRIIPYGETCLI